MKRVYIHEVGLVSAAGNDADQHLRFHGIRENPLPPLDYETIYRRVPARKMVKFLSHSALLMELAAVEAMKNISAADYDPERIGLYAATGLAGGNLDESMASLEASCDPDGISLAKFNRDGLKALNPLMSFQVLANIPGCIVSIIHHIKGDNLLFNPFEDQGANALYEGYDAVAAGRMDGALVLAGDDPAHPANSAYLQQNGIFFDSDIPNSAGAAVFLSASPKNALGEIEAIDIKYNGAGFFDPLRHTFGRLMAVAPLAQFVMNAKGMDCPCRIAANGQTLQWRIHHG